jgi:anti-sigma B factor antagonist
VTDTFEIEDRAIDDESHLLALTGQVDLYSAPEFKSRLVQVIERGKKCIVVDLTKVTFMDSTALGVLVGGLRRVRPLGGSIDVVSADERIIKLFEITGLDRTFRLFESDDAALASLTTQR